MTNLLEQIEDPKIRTTIQQEMSRLETENRLLREQLQLMRIKTYGRPGQQELDDAQLTLLEQEPGVSMEEVQKEAALSEEEKKQAAQILKKPRKPHPGRNELPAHLERRVTVVACTAEQCRCGQCGEEKKVIGYEVSERLEVEPPKFYVNQTKREKRACANCEEQGVSTAPVSVRIIEKGKAGDALVVSTVIKKYAMHMPLYRQSLEIEREAGVEISVKTLCNWVMQVGFLLEYVCVALKADLLSGGYIQADETPVRVLLGAENGGIPRKRPGKSHQAYLWVYSRPGGPVLFDYQMGRSREGPKLFLGNFNGFLQCDGYSAYHKIGGEGIRIGGCWTHVFRKFRDAVEVAAEADASLLMHEIGKLYEVEREAMERNCTPEQRLALRKERSAPLMGPLKKQMEEVRQKSLPKSLCSRACGYALEEWGRLQVYLEDGRIEIDNNWCENAIRPVALGRKNWLHIGSPEAGPRVAAIMSVMETCRRLDVNVRDYLMGMLPLVADWPASRVAELTPMAWKARGNKPPIR